MLMNRYASLEGLDSQGQAAQLIITIQEKTPKSQLNQGIQ